MSPPQHAHLSSAALVQLAERVFGASTFEDLKTGVGIVATHWKHETPLIFRGSAKKAHGRQSTFEPGFGCTIAEAIRASCSAYPFFKRTTLMTSKGDHVELFDGGYCANNPTLYALADALVTLKHEPSNVRVVSLGVGIYPEPKRWYSWLARRFMPLPLLQKTLNVNTLSMDQLREILFRGVPTVRINDTFAHPEMATNLMEHNLVKLDALYQRGGESFAAYEKALRQLMGLPAAMGEVT